MRIREATLSLAIAVILACGNKEEAAKPADHDHAHGDAPHGGEILDLGGGAAHLEMIHDHDGGNVTVYVLGSDLKTPVAVEAPIISLVTKDGPVQFTLTAVNAGADGKADTWKGSHAGLISDPWDGRIRVKIGDKTYQSPLEGKAH